MGPLQAVWSHSGSLELVQFPLHMLGPSRQSDLASAPSRKSWVLPDAAPQPGHWWMVLSTCKRGNSYIQGCLRPQSTPRHWGNLSKALRLPVFQPAAQSGQKWPPRSLSDPRPTREVSSATCRWRQQRLSRSLSSTRKNKGQWRCKGLGNYTDTMGTNARKGSPRTHMPNLSRFCQIRRFRQDQGSL